MLRFEKVAIPLTALTVVVPLNVADGDPGPSAIVTALLAPATTLPLASCTATVTAGVTVVPAVAEDGDCVKASFVAVRSVEVRVGHVGDVSPGAEADSV